MDIDVTYETQHLWTTWFAIYLYFGGLGSALIAIAFLTDMYLKPHKNLALWGALAGLIMVGGGSAMLFMHLANHIAVIYVLNPLAIFVKPDAWITWGTQFISWMLIASLFYALPYMTDSPFMSRMLVVGQFLRAGLVCSIGRAVAGHKIHRVLGLIAVISGVGVTVYTGLLLQSFPAVALWNNPGVPVLFTISAFSTACAFLMLVMHVFMYRENDKSLRELYGRADLSLIAIELLVVFLFYMYLIRGTMSARVSADLLFHDLGWLFGFIGLGLVVPFLIELNSVLRHENSGHWHDRLSAAAAAILVLVGGFLLRDYFMAAGIYAYPA